MKLALPKLELPRVALSVLSAVGMVLCCPTWDQFWLGFIMWIPYFAAIEGVRPRAAFAYGWITGTITVFWGFFWLSDLLVKFAGIPLPGALPITFLFALWHGMLWSCAALLIALLRSRTTAPLWLVAPVAWVAVEALLPNIFPIYMGHGWCWQPVLIQTAELGSVTFVSAVMVATNAALYEILRAKRAGEGWNRRAIIAAFVLIAGNLTYGTVRIAQVESEMAARPHLKFGVVQGNMSIRQMAQAPWRMAILKAQQRMTAQLQAQGAQIALWGETAYPNPRAFRRESTEDLPEGHPWRVRDGFTIPVLFGTVTRSASGDTPYPFNTAILLDEQGRIAGMYDKVYRLIFGEYAPLVDPEWYLDMVPSASHIARGAGPDVLELGPWRLGPFICYEDILPRFVRQAADQDVHAFVNLTNDAWFGKTDEPAQHLGLALLRAVEHRKPLVRSVNTGISVYVDPTGRTHHATAVTDPDVDGPQPPDGFVVDVPMMDPDARTLYGRTGEGFNGLCVLVTLGLLIRRRRGGDASDAVGANAAARS